jgi:NAD/NADP transhydrogenase beta subunit
MSRSPKSLATDPFIWVMLLLFIVCNLCVFWIFLTIWSKVDMTELRSQTFAVRLMQVTLGMVIGLAVTFLGVVVAWFGLTEDVNLEVDAPKAKGKLAAAGPGALLVICGTLLILMCIHKEFRIYDTKPIPTIDSPIDNPAKPEPS